MAKIAKVYYLSMKKWRESPSKGGVVSLTPPKLCISENILHLIYIHIIFLLISSKKEA